MSKPKPYKIVEAPCPKCGKVLKGLSEKHWMRNLRIHLVADPYHYLSSEEVDRILKTVKPSFHVKTKMTKPKAGQEVTL